jgi:beta-aspartyl-peptidase (threonine type)
MSQPSPTLVVHGGAYDIPTETHQAHVEGCRRAAEAGWAVLARGGPALDAVEAAVRVMEDDPTFDAGYGSFLNAAGEVELDAIIMDGRDLDLGAVAAVQRVRHPVTLARLVMTASEHALLAGAGAEAFARQHGLPVCSTEELLAGRELERWRAAYASGNPHEWEPFGNAQGGPFGNAQGGPFGNAQGGPFGNAQGGPFGVACPEQGRGAQGRSSGIVPPDTVGAVALDADGNLAAATSTGGTFNKLPGRVGDSPLVGCGAYADNRTGAVSATGLGEALMKVVIAKTACDFIASGMTAQQAADAAIAVLAGRTTGEGGLIVLDRLGGVGIAHNTPYIAHAVITAGRKVITGIE